MGTSLYEMMPFLQSGPVVRTTSKKAGRHASKATPTTVEGVVTEILHIFVDALPHIPDHRKLSLFTHLLETVGTGEYLHVVLALMVEKLVTQNTEKEDDDIVSGSGQGLKSGCGQNKIVDSR